MNRATTLMQGHNPSVVGIQSNVFNPVSFYNPESGVSPGAERTIRPGSDRPRMLRNSSNATAFTVQDMWTGVTKSHPHKAENNPGGFRVPLHSPTISQIITPTRDYGQQPGPVHTGPDRAVRERELGSR